MRRRWPMHSEVVTAIKAARRQQAVVEYHAVPAPRWLVLLPLSVAGFCLSFGVWLGLEQPPK